MTYSELMYLMCGLIGGFIAGSLLVTAFYVLSKSE